MAAAGADLVDVGGESTRPGAERVAPRRSSRASCPVVDGARRAPASRSASTPCAPSAARAAVEAGACIVNDVSGGLADPRMLTAVAALDVPYVAMHWRGHSDRMDDLACYDDVVADVVAELDRTRRRRGRRRRRPRADRARPRPRVRQGGRPQLGAAAGARPRCSPSATRCWSGPRASGSSARCSPADGEPRALAERDDATDAITALARPPGVWCVRVHDVRGSRDAVEVAAAWLRGRG